MADSIDIQALADEFEFEPDDIRKMASMFFISADKGLNMLETAIISNNIEAIFKAAHSIKGSAGTLRLQELHDYALEVETTARKNESYDYTAAYTKLAGMIDEISKRFRYNGADF